MKDSIIKKISIIILCFCSVLISFGEANIKLPVIELAGKQYYVYEIKKDESAYGIAKKMGWDVEELLKVNPTASGSLKKGTKIYYPVDATDKNLNELVENNKGNNSQYIRHTVKKGETIYSISRMYDVPLDVLYTFNPSAKRGVKRDEIIRIPKDFQSVGHADIKDSLETVDNDNFIISRGEGYYTEEDDQIGDDESFGGVKMALIMDEPSSNKDIDFTRGLLIRLSELEECPDKIDLKIIDGGRSSGELITELEDYEPNVIISTADKTFPLFLVDFGNTNNIPIVNVFDLKNDLYEDNSTIIQILPPSSYFYDKIAAEIYRLNKHRKMLLVGNADENDGLALELITLFGDNIETLSLEDFGSLEPDIIEPVVIYSYGSKKEEVYDFFNNVDHLKETFPGYDFHIIGRLSWIAMIDELGDKFENYSVSIPARAWVDEDSEDWKSFSDAYGELFNSEPVRSIPNFAASGYDIGKYFIELILKNKGSFIDMNFPAGNSGLQNDLILSKVNNNGGYLNNVGYIVKFNPEGKKEKILIK